MQPKKIGHTTLLGERGVNLVARRVMEMGFVWYPTGSVEAGIDGHIELRDAETGEVFNAVIGVQSKATDHSFPNETATGFDFYCNKRDLDYWLKGNLPVVLVVSRHPLMRPTGSQLRTTSAIRRGAPSGKCTSTSGLIASMQTAVMCSSNSPHPGTLASTWPRPGRRNV